jgi:hypothetical protein
MKQKGSILDPFAARLAQWLTPKEDGGDGLTLAQAQQQLESDGCKISVGRLSEWWAAKQKRDNDKAFLRNIANGSEMSKQVKSAFKDNPPPEIQTLINVVQSLIMTLQVKGEANPKYLEMADRLLHSVLEFARMQTDAGFEQVKIQIRQAAEDRMQKKLLLEREKFEMEFCEKILDKATREAAERIASSNMSNADKISAMRKEAFKAVDELQASGKVVIPK